jgi:hypothetical protein
MVYLKLRYRWETTLNNVYGLQNEGQDCKTGVVREQVIMGEG